MHCDLKRTDAPRPPVRGSDERMGPRRHLRGDDSHTRQKNCQFLSGLEELARMRFRICANGLRQGRRFPLLPARAEAIPLPPRRFKRGNLTERGRGRASAGDCEGEGLQRDGLLSGGSLGELFVVSSLCSSDVSPLEIEFQGDPTGGTSEFLPDGNKLRSSVASCRDAFGTAGGGRCAPDLD